MKYGFYSEMARINGTFWYSTPDGREVEVTATNDKPAFPEYKWSDSRYIGPVTKFLRVGIAPQNYMSEVDWNEVKKEV